MEIFNALHCILPNVIVETEDVLGSVSSVVTMTTGCGKDNTNIQFLLFLFFMGIISFNALCKFLRLGNSAWDFFEVNFWSRQFFGLFWKPYGFFWVLIFAPIRSSPSLEIRSNNLPPPPPALRLPVYSLLHSRVGSQEPLISPKVKVNKDFLHSWSFFDYNEFLIGCFWDTKETMHKNLY